MCPRDTATDEPEPLVTDGRDRATRTRGVVLLQTRHRLCTCHVLHSMAHILGLDGMAVAERTTLPGTLSGVLSRGGARGGEEYRRMIDEFDAFPRAQGLLERAEPLVLYSPPSAECTTGIMEREMQEVNRRTDVGARWSIAGVANLTRLRLAERQNPDDYKRVWSPLQAPAQITVSTC